jgi:hypothetical protein
MRSVASQVRANAQLRARTIVVNFREPATMSLVSEQRNARAATPSRCKFHEGEDSPMRTEPVMAANEPSTTT